MDSYTITIAPNDDSGNSTTLVVDTSGDQVRITDVHLHAADGLAGGTMPTVDFGLLLRAVGPSPSEQPSIETAPAGVPTPAETAAQPADSAEPAPEPQPVKASRSPRATRTRAATPVAEPKRPRSRRASAAKAAAPEEATTSTRRRRAAAAPAKAAPAKKAAAKKAAAKKAAASGGGRAYRRMPEDFPAVYQQSSSPAALAEHYGVPRHTAQAWIRRIKASS